MGRKKYNVAVAGATGAVGRKLIEVLEKRNFPVSVLKLLASKRSAGEIISFGGREHVVEVMKEDSFDGADIALFSAGASVSSVYAPIAVRSGAVVIDNSSCFRNDPSVPLVIPEINPGDASLHKGIISNPNCTTAIMLMALYPVYKAAGIKKIIVSTYQSVSGAGMKGIVELEEQILNISKGIKPEMSVFKYPIAFNLIPHIDSFTGTGYTKEEIKMLNETRKILHDDKIKVSATCVRVPVKSVHSMSVTFVTEQNIKPDDVRDFLRGSKGIKVIDEPDKNRYPMPVSAEGEFDCFAGRIRKDSAFRNGISMWICGDQLLKGAALNAVQIAELLIK